MAINVLFMASPLFMKAQDRNTACRGTKFHISLECSMNRAAVSRPGLRSIATLLRRTIFSWGAVESFRRDSLAMVVNWTKQAFCGPRTCAGQYYSGFVSDGIF
jgi:hypothetical protein